MVTGKSMAYDAGNRIWRGAIQIEAHISNAGIYKEV